MSKKDKDRFYYDKEFLGSPDARSVRILSEYYGPLQRIKRNGIQDFLVFFGSARIQSKEQAQTNLDSASKDISPSELDDLKSNLEIYSPY